VLAGLMIGVILAAVFSEHCRTNPPPEEFLADSPR
jgi:hypothetical protein